MFVFRVLAYESYHRCVIGEAHPCFLAGIKFALFCSGGANTAVSCCRAAEDVQEGGTLKV